MKLGELVGQGCPDCKAPNTLCLIGKKGFRQEIYWNDQQGLIKWGDEDDPNYIGLTVDCDFCNFVADVTPKYGRPVDEFEVELEED